MLISRPDHIPAPQSKKAGPQPQPAPEREKNLSKKFETKVDIITFHCREGATAAQKDQATSQDLTASAWQSRDTHSQSGPPASA